MRAPIRPRHEILLAGAALLGLSLAVLTPHIRHGGFYSDDWSIAASQHFDGWWRTSVDEWRHAIPERPILALLHPLPYAVFGLDASYHHAAAAVLVALTSLSFFVLLRTLDVELPHALAMAGLATIFPWADATRLWPTGVMNDVAVIAYFAGSVVAIRALELAERDRRRALVLHAGASVLYVASLLTYEVAPVAILLSGLLYRTRVSWRALRARWLVDAVLVLVVVAFAVYVSSGVRHVGSLHDRVADLPHFVGQGLTIFASIFVPPGASASWQTSWKVASPAAGKLVVLAAALAVVLLGLARARRDSRVQLRTWLYRAAGGAIGVAAAYVVFLGSGLVPLFYPGVDDRTNTLAAYGFVVAAYSLLALLGLLVGGGRRGIGAIVLAAGAIVAGVGFVQRVRTDERNFDAAAVAQARFLERLEVAVPRPSHGSTIFTFGAVPELAPGVPVFKYTWDLGGAIDLRWHDGSLRGVPVYGSNVTCGRRSVVSPAFLDEPAAYGRAVFVDIPTARARPVGSREACIRARPDFAPGPGVSAGPPNYGARGRLRLR